MDYVDALLRKGGLPKPPEDSEIEGRLDALITLCVSFDTAEYYRVTSRLLVHLVNVDLSHLNGLFAFSQICAFEG